MKAVKSLSLTFALLLTFTIASCGSSGGSSPNEIEVLFRDRTEKNSVEGGFQVSLNDDIAKTGAFETLTVFPVSSKLEVGELLKFEFFGTLVGVLRATVVGIPEVQRVVIEVRDYSIDFLANEWIELSGPAIGRRYIDQDVALKQSLRVARHKLDSAILAVAIAANKNYPKSTDSTKKFNSAYDARRASLNSEISLLEEFVLDFPTLSNEVETLLSLVREQTTLTGMIAVSNSASDMNPRIDSLNLLSSKIADAEFRLFGAIDKIVNS